MTVYEIQLKALLAGTHVLVRLEGEHDFDGEIACVPKDVFETWKAAIKQRAGTGNWPNEITDSVHAYLSNDAIFPITRSLLTWGDDSGIVDGDEDYRI